MSDGPARKPRRKADSPDAGDARDIVRVRAGKLHDVVDMAERLLADCEIFQRGGQLVHVAQRKARHHDNSIEWHEGIGTAGMGALRYLLAQRARFERFDMKAQEFRACDPPKPAVEALMAASQWPNVRDLHQLIAAPTMLPDGSIIDRKGYDPKSGLYLTKALDGIIVPPKPTKAEADRANDKLVAIFSGFPFRDDVVPGLSLAVALNGVLTAVLRPAIRAPAPLIGITAPKAGTGKSYMVDIISMIATGRRAPVISAGSKAEEFAKSLYSGLLAGWPLLSLDNLTRSLGGDELEVVLTQERVETRLLGYNKMVTVPTSAALFATGNNLKIRGACTRRVLLCLIDSGQEFPEQREFEFDLLADVERRRAELISAALTIARWHHQTPLTPDEPKGLPFGSYEVWCSRVRDPLIRLGHPDPVASLRIVRDTDPESEALEVLAGTWAEALGDREVTCREVIAHVTDQLNGNVLDTDFAVALLAVAEKAKRIDTQRLGTYLKKCEYRIVGGKRFVRTGKDQSNVVRWQLQIKK